ncbi:MAG: hypothetical protein IJM33_00445 [Bacteroidales bacterium]|nr:hypothetical protein [Bacteroidales bacterium]MBR3412219.1 hypothetical protein [Bacteroidales bacterium]
MNTRQITAQIPVAYYDTVVTMFKGLGISYEETINKKKAPEPGSKEYILDSICRGMEEVRLWEQGKLQLPTLEDVLNEL